MQGDLEALLVKDISQLTMEERKALQEKVLYSPAVCQIFGDILVDLKSIFGFATEDKQNIQDFFGFVRLGMRWYKSHLGHLTILPMGISALLYIFNSLGFTTTGFAHGVSQFLQHLFN